MTGPEVALLLSAGLFCLGIVGVIARRTSVSSLLSLELMLCAAVVALASFDLMPRATGATGDAVQGRAFALLVFSIALAQSFIGLALLIAQRRGSRARTSESSSW